MFWIDDDTLHIGYNGRDLRLHLSFSFRSFLGRLQQFFSTSSIRLTNQIMQKLFGLTKTGIALFDYFVVCK